VKFTSFPGCRYSLENVTLSGRASPQVVHPSHLGVCQHIVLKSTPMNLGLTHIKCIGCKENWMYWNKLKLAKGTKKF